MPEASDGYYGAAIASLRTFAHSELAFSEFEAVAKLIEVHRGATPFQPHHLTTAKNHLLDTGEIVTESAPSRGGRDIPLLRTGIVGGRGRQIEDVASRKRLLLSRYYGLTQGSETAGEGLSGAAGEIAIHGAIVRAGVGTSLATTFRDRPSVSTIFDQPVPLGPLDNAFILQPLTADSLPKPPYGVVVPVEVKNIREWVYPHTKELYQLLHKSVLLHRLFPQRPIVPLFVCRRLHVTTTFMAKDLGFFVVDARRHYFPTHSRIDVAKLNEVRKELGLSDIVQDLTATGRVGAGLKALQLKYDVELAADRWRNYATDDEFLELVQTLHRVDAPHLRRRAMDRLRVLCAALGSELGW